MLKNAILFPPSGQFWAQCARQLINLMQYDSHFIKGSGETLSTLDFSALRVIVPVFEHAQLLTSAMSAELGAHFIPPRINTLSAWLSMQIPEQNEFKSIVKPISEGERVMMLYAQLREHAWLKKLFSARKNTDLLPLAQTLITLSDELTQAMLPQVLCDGIEQVQQVWHQALAAVPFPMSAQQMLSDEAQLVWQIWTSQLDGQDAISVRFHQMLRLAEMSADPLLWINSVMPEGLDQYFLKAYANKNPVQIISLDWRATALSSIFSTAWQEVVDVADVVKTADEFDANFLAISHASKVTLNHVSTIAADSLEQEAQWGAQIIVDWLQQGKSTVALIAQDRVVARRIRALLDRAQVHVSDETGWKLSTTRAAAALAAWFDVVTTRADTVLFLDLLKSPYFEPDNMSGFDEKSTWVMAIEMALLRENVVGGWDAIANTIRTTLNVSSEYVALVERLKRIAARFSEKKRLADWLELTQQTLGELGILDRWQQDSAGQQLAQLLEKLNEDCAQLSEIFSFSEWRSFINLQLESTSFLGEKSDSRVVMLPLNGARLRRFDAVLIAGCDATHLPSQPKEMLFFTNTVRRECGLATREHRQRQQLRDFAEVLLTNSEIVLSWQRQQHGENNPVSPWIERLNLCLQRRGLTQLDVRHVQLTSQTLPVITSQQPRPVAPNLQPATLSASGYNSFMVCPYQFFATRMLGLFSLDTLSDRPEKRDYGTWLHAILKTYHDTLKKQSDAYPKEKQETLLREISQTMFIDILQERPAALGFSIRWGKVIPAYVAWSQRFIESGWKFEMGEVWLEKQLEWDEGKITLRGQVDRIDKNQEGEYAVLDYKTNPVSALNKKIRDAEDQQLPFYGLLAEQFEQSSMIISSAYYVALEMTNEKVADVNATNYLVRKQNLKKSIIHNMTEIGRGAALLAQGINQVCQYCDVRGLCRKGAW